MPNASPFHKGANGGSETSATCSKSQSPWAVGLGFQAALLPGPGPHRRTHNTDFGERPLHLVPQITDPRSPQPVAGSPLCQASHPSSGPGEQCKTGSACPGSRQLLGPEKGPTARRAWKTSEWDLKAKWQGGQAWRDEGTVEGAAGVPRPSRPHVLQSSGLCTHGLHKRQEHHQAALPAGPWSQALGCNAHPPRSPSHRNGPGPRPGRLHCLLNHARICACEASHSVRCHRSALERHSDPRETGCGEGLSLGRWPPGGMTTARDRLPRTSWTAFHREASVPRQRRSSISPGRWGRGVRQTAPSVPPGP